MINIIPCNGNVLIRIKQNADELVTASGIILALVEQDVNIAEVVAVPNKRLYETIDRQLDGTLIRDDEGKPKVVTRHVDVNPGDKVIMEKRFHHDYDWHHRDRIDHTFFLDELTRDKNDGYDYFLTSNDDILLTYVATEPLSGNVFGELYSQIPPKPVTQV